MSRTIDNYDDPGYPTNLLGLDDGLQVVVVVVEPNYRAISEPTYSRGIVEKPDYKTNLNFSFTLFQASSVT